MKGQNQAVTAIMISGILIGVAGSVYFWGVPLIQKSRDANLLESSESLMFLIDKKIKTIADSGGRESIKLFDKGTIRFSGGKLFYTISTDGSIYASNADIPLGRTENCDNSIHGNFETGESSVLCVTSRQLENMKYDNVYSLSYRPLDSGLRTYKIELVGDNAIGGPESYVIIENTGLSEEIENGKIITSVKIKISIQR